MFYYVRTSAGKVARIVLIALGLVGCWNIVLTGSRAGMVGALFLVFLIVMRSRRKMRYALAGLVLLVVVAAIMPAQYKHRFESIADISGNTAAAASARGRLKGLHDGLILFADHPLTGVGIGCYGTARGEELGDWMSAHNMLGQLIAETGLLGTIAFGIFIWAVFYTIRECRRILRRSSGSPDHSLLSGLTEAIFDSYLLLFVIGLSGHNLYRYNWYFLAAMLTVVYRLALAQDRQGDTTQSFPSTRSVSSHPART
jgi:O-antigen ligase